MAQVTHKDSLWLTARHIRKHFSTGSRAYRLHLLSLTLHKTTHSLYYVTYNLVSIKKITKIDIKTRFLTDVAERQISHLNNKIFSEKKKITSFLFKICDDTMEYYKHVLQTYQNGILGTPKNKYHITTRNISIHT